MHRVICVGAVEVPLDNAVPNVKVNMAMQIFTAPAASTVHDKLRAFPVDRKISLFFGVLLALAVVNALLARQMLWHQQDVSDVRSLVNKMGSLGQQAALEAIGIVLGGEGSRQHVRDSLREVELVLTALREGGAVDGLIVRPLPVTLQASLQGIQNWRDALLRRLSPVLHMPSDLDRQTSQMRLQWHDALLHDVTGMWDACRSLIRALVNQRIQSQQRALWQLYGLLLFDALVLLGAYAWMRRTLVQPLRALAAGWRRLAAGDYQVRMTQTTCAEVSEVTQAFNASVERIGHLLKQTEENLWRQANYDELTALPNRYMFRHRLLSEIRRSQRKVVSMALLFLDLNLFKDVNDSYGHESGDCVLQQVSKRLTGCVREVDMVARLGGDEFTIILNELGDRSVVTGICADLQVALAAPFDLGGTTVYLSCSIGVAFYPEHGDNPEELLHHADVAMYQAKRMGHGGCVFYGDELQHGRSSGSGDARGAIT